MALETRPLRQWSQTLTLNLGDTKWSIDTLIERIQKVENLERPDWKQESAVRTNTKSISNPLNDPEREVVTRMTWKRITLHGAYPAGSKGTHRSLL